MIRNAAKLSIGFFVVGILFFGALLNMVYAQDAVACTADVFACPDGSFVGRTGPDCNFVCASGTFTEDGSEMTQGDTNQCPADTQQCPDNSYVSRTGPNCSFAACPLVVNDERDDQQIDFSQLGITPDNLISGRTFTFSSDNFRSGRGPEKLWDNCFGDNDVECFAGNVDIASFWVEFDLDEEHHLTTARLFGETVGTWVSTAWTLEFKEDLDDPWSTAFRNHDAYGNQWFEENLNIEAQHIRLTVTGDTEIDRTQAREFQLFGVPMNEVLEIDVSNDTSETEGVSSGAEGGASSSGGSSVFDFLLEPWQTGTEFISGFVDNILRYFDVPDPDGGVIFFDTFDEDSKKDANNDGVADPMVSNPVLGLGYTTNFEEGYELEKWTMVDINDDHYAPTAGFWIIPEGETHMVQAGRSARSVLYANSPVPPGTVNFDIFFDQYLHDNDYIGFVINAPAQSMTCRGNSCDTGGVEFGYERQYPDGDPRGPEGDTHSPDGYVRGDLGEHIVPGIGIPHRHQWKSHRIEVRGTHIAWFIDNELIVEGNVPNINNGGYFGIRQHYDRNTRYDNVLIQSVPIDPSAFVAAIRGAGGTGARGPSGDFGPVDTAPPSGSIQISPSEQIQSVVTQHPPGTTFYLQAGEYRNQADLTGLQDGDVLMGARGAIISGAEVLSDWSQSGGTWSHAINFDVQAQMDSIAGEWNLCKPDTDDRCTYPNDLFINDVPQWRMPSGSPIGPGQWKIQNGRVYIAENPAGKTIEVSDDPNFISFNGAAADNVTISNLVFEKFATRRQGTNNTGAVNTASFCGGTPSEACLGDNWVIENNLFQHNHSIGLRAKGSNVVIRGNSFFENGGTGLTARDSHNLLVDDNEFAYNNYAAFNYGYEAGGFKILGSDSVVISNNYAHHNDGVALWMDWENIGTVHEGNVVEFNARAGIEEEGNRGGIIRNNVVKFNGHNNANNLLEITGAPILNTVGNESWAWSPNILISLSSETMVENNTVVTGEYGNAISIINNGSRTSSIGIPNGIGNEVNNNTFIFTEEALCAPNQGCNGFVAIVEDGNRTPKVMFTHADRNIFRGNQYIGPNVTGQRYMYGPDFGRRMNFAEWQANGMDVDGSATNDDNPTIPETSFAGPTGGFGLPSLPGIPGSIQPSGFTAPGTILFGSATGFEEGIGGGADEDNLIHVGTHLSDSENFMAETSVGNLWDGCFVLTNLSCGPASITSESFWVTFDLGEVENLGLARLFGDDHNNAVTNAWKLEGKLNQGDAWEELVPRTQAGAAWSSSEVGARAQFLRLTVYGNPGSGSVQAREFQVFRVPQTLAYASFADYYVGFDAAACQDNGNPARDRLGFFPMDHGLSHYPQSVNAQEQWLGRQYCFHTSASQYYDFVERRAPDLETHKRLVTVMKLAGDSCGAEWTPQFQGDSTHREPTASEKATRRACYERTSSGEFDNYYRTIANQLIEGGNQNAIIRIGHEFNGPWHKMRPKGIEQSYINAFRHIVNVVRSVPGQQFVIDWNPSSVRFDEAMLAYPGNDFVDVIGLDAYCQESTRGPVENRAEYRQHLNFAVSKGKPVSYPEWGVWTEDTAHCIEFYYLLFNSIPSRGIQLFYHSYFDDDGARFSNSSSPSERKNHLLRSQNGFPGNPNAERRFVELFGGTQPINPPTWRLPF